MKHGDRPISPAHPSQKATPGSTGAAATGAASGIARDPGWFNLLALKRDGYDFIARLCERHRSDAVMTRVMLRPALVAYGVDAAHLFYRPDAFTRVGAMPPTTLRLLQDKGSVQTLDADAHRHRKALFVSLIDADATQRLTTAFEHRFHAALPGWSAAPRVVLHEEFQRLLCAAACDWLGLDAARVDVGARTRECAAMIDRAAAFGPSWLHAAWLRRRCERWARGLIAAARDGRLTLADDAPLLRLARHRDSQGQPLSLDVAAVELLNLLRPIIATARYLSFAALALHEHPDAVRQLQRDGLSAAALDGFAQEVRRYYPFFPMIGGRARHAIEWRGQRLPAGTWMLLGLDATNHDPRLWEEPGAFRPERFRDRVVGPNVLIPQGGGPVAEGHRCPGEPFALALIATATRLLLDAVRYRVPRQDLRVSRRRMPTRPASGFIITDVQLTSA